MGMILRIASSRIVGQGDMVGRSGYFSLNLSANSVMRGRLDARRTLKSLVADLRKMKKIFIFLGLMFVMLSSTYAQKGRQAIGFGLSYGTEIESAGLGIKYQYNITNPLRIEPSFNYFFENDNVSMLDLNVNFHYLCPVAQSVKLYPLFGLTMSNWMFDMHDLDVDWDGDHVHVDDGGNHNEFRIGVNLGAGAEFALGRNWAMNVEFRYQLVDDFDQGVINFGAAYRF